MKHILIIGGTGMLRGATEHFIEQGHIVTLMARNEQRLNAIKQKHPGFKPAPYPYTPTYKVPAENGTVQTVRLCELFCGACWSV
jgi:NAD(P)-dependent dehydrogenase (short-subunit alcohol dehydrogenase family)